MDLTVSNRRAASAEPNKYEHSIALPKITVYRKFTENQERSET